jgi:SAM-dependent methyltransferase
MSSKPPEFFEGTEMPTAGWWEALWPEPAAVLAVVGIKPEMEVIDLCSGDGWFTVQMARIARQVIAIDIDAEMLEVARLRLAEAGLFNCGFRAGDAYRLRDFTERPVDFVFLANAFHGVPDRLRLAHVVRDVLKPSGRFAIINWHKLPREQTVVLGEPRGPPTELRLSPRQTIDVVATSGLKHVKTVELPPYHYCALFERRAF